MSAPAAPAPGVSNVRVALRVRPIESGTIICVPRKDVVSITKEAATGGNQWLSSQRGSEHEHTFDRVYDPSSTQEEVYEWSGRPLVTSAVAEGRNATILVYGATGAGKTHTMFGTDGDLGLVHRALDEVFAIACEIDSLVAKVSFLELYNEKVEDLLQEGGGTCDIREDARNQFMQINGLREVPVASREEALQTLQLGMLQRKVEATAANARSSRSHAIFQLKLERVDSGQPHAKICLIDLAGSERASQTKNVGRALQDGAKINTSLLALAECIKALADERKKDGRIPFYNSKLTRLLKYSFKGDGLVSMIANIHPGREHYEDSHNTIIYAKHAAGITVEPVVRRAPRTSSQTPTGQHRSIGVATPTGLLGAAALPQVTGAAQAAAPQQALQPPPVWGFGAGLGSSTPAATPTRGGSRHTTPVRRPGAPGPGGGGGSFAGAFASGAGDSRGRAQGAYAVRERSVSRGVLIPPGGPPAMQGGTAPSSSSGGVSRGKPMQQQQQQQQKLSTPRNGSSGSSTDRLSLERLPPGIEQLRTSSSGADRCPDIVAAAIGTASPTQSPRNGPPARRPVAPASASSAALPWVSCPASAGHPAMAGALGGAGEARLAQGASVWLTIVETLQAEKAALERRLAESDVERELERDRLQAEVARLRAANREKDEQILALISASVV